ncbi:MAG: exosortase H-associated membrane protein [bacterium]
MRRPVSLLAWGARLALALPLCFALWYAGARAADPLVASLAPIIVNAISGGVVTQTETGKEGITFVTRLRTGGGVVTIDTESRIYSYGLPLAVAIAVAAMPPGLWWKLAAIVAVSLPVVVWGVSFDVLAHLLRSAPAWSAETFGPTGSMLIAVAYQFGSLIFPGLVPVGLAVALSWDQLAAHASQAIAARRKVN